ncbi:MAG TPA: PAS domain-containing protein [Stellaceae bacterium]|nr:PAS domain-containing protein [Stellaceae bacterium]
MTRSDGWIHFDQDHQHSAGACSTTGDLIGILDAVDVPIVVVSREFRVTCFNRAAAELLGFEPSDIGGSPADMPLLRSFRELEARCAQAIATETAYRYDFRDRDKSYLLRVAPYVQSDGRITGSVLTFANVTAFRASIDQAIYEREYTKTILNTVTDPLAVLDRELRILTGNRAFYTMFGLSREPMLSPWLGEIANGALDHAPLQELLKSAVTEGGEFEPYEIDHDFPRIGRRIVLLSACRFALPGNPGNMLLLVMRDVTAQRHAENELRDRERRIRELINALPAAVYTTDAKGRVTFYNEAAVEFAGRQPALGTDEWCICSRLFRPDGRPMPRDQSPMAVALKERRAVRGSEAIAERPDGTRVTFIPYPTPLHDSSGTLIGAVNMLVDITERKKAEEAVRRLAETLEERVAQRTMRLEEEIAEREKAQAALRQSQKMEAVGQLTGGVAHDFNNLLTVVTGNLDLLERWADANPPARRYVETAQRAAWQGARLTQQLLAFSRQQELRPEIVHLGQAMGEYEGLLCRALDEAIEVTITCDPDLWLCRIDPAQFENSILNLAFNARDAMPAGGTLTISLGNIELSGPNGPAGAAPGQYVLVAVADTGVGIEPDRIDRVFEPFYTTKGVGLGTGLGLSQVYGFVEQSGGYVGIESTVGAGTTVMIYLPKAPGIAADRELRSPVTEAAAPGSETVLLVEDDQDVLEVVTTMMEDLGYRVLTARNGVEALSILERDEAIDLLFTDLVMPNGISGGALALRARQMRPELKILLGSGYSARTSPDIAAAVADLPILSKPYRRDELAAKLRSILAVGDGFAAKDYSARSAWPSSAAKPFNLGC